MSDNILPHHTRKLRVIEKHHLHQNINQLYNNFNVTAVYNHLIDTSIISCALRQLILKYPILSCNIFRDCTTTIHDDARLNYDNFTVYPVSKMMIEDVVSWGNVEKIDGNFLQGLERVQIPVDIAYLPLWRIKVNKCGDVQYVTVIFEHTTFDGNSGFSFHQDLLVEMAKLNESGYEFQPDLFNYNRDFKQLPPLIRLPKSVSRIYQLRFKQTMTAIFKSIGPKWLIKFTESYFISNHPNLYQNPRFTHGTGSKLAPKTGYHLINLTSFQTSIILDNCRNFGFTMTPLLYTVATSSLQDTVFNQVDANVEFSTDFSIVINGRRFIKPSMVDELKYENIVGCFASTLSPQPSFYQDDMEKPTVSKRFLKSAKKLSMMLCDNLTTSSSCSMIALLRLVNIAKYIQTTQLSNDKITLEVSNLGLIDNLDDAWKMIDLVFSQSIGYPLNFGLSVATTVEGGMNIVVGNNDRFDEMKGDTVKEFVEMFKERLLQFGRLEMKCTV